MFTCRDPLRSVEVPEGPKARNPLSSTLRRIETQSINTVGEEEQRQPTEGVIVFAVSYVWQANRSATSGSTPSSI